MGATLAEQRINGRIIWIDQLRAIAMLFVILGHSSIDKNAVDYFYSFHMPLFFIISGITHRPGKYESLKQIVIDKAKRLLVPYVVLNIITFPIWFCSWKILDDAKSTLFDLLKGLFYVNSNVYQTPSPATWFLVSLFFAEIVLYLLERISKNNSAVLTCLVMITGLAGYVEGLNTKLQHVLHLDDALTAVVFIYIGYIFYQNKDKILKLLSNKALYVILIVGFIALGYYFQSRNGRISMHNNRYHSIIYFYLSALLTSFAVIFASFKIPYLKSLTYIGKNTIVYLGLHAPIIILTEHIFPIFEENVWAAFALAVIEFFALIPVCMLINRFLPIATGQFDFRRKQKKTGNC
ncbi:MAG: acyltransferase family protein [Acutalibacteraceae bacterium]